MIPNEDTIKRYSDKVYRVLPDLSCGTFEEIQLLCQMGNTELCFALIYLLRENKIKQEYANGQVRYKMKSRSDMV